MIDADKSESQLLEELAALRARVAELEGGAPGRAPAAEETGARRERVQRQQAAIVKLATHESVAAGNFEQAARAATEIAAAALDVERVGIWLLSDDRGRFDCIDLFERGSGKHTSGDALDPIGHPRYFEALAAGRAIDASEAQSDVRTSEFAEGYLVPLGITSMLDAPIRREGQVIGAVCHEHLGPSRTWQPDELTFAAEIADQVTQALMNSERKRALEQLERERHLFIGGPVVVFRWVAEEGWPVEYVSPNVSELFGHSAEDFMTGRVRYALVVHPDDLERIVAEVAAHSEKGATCFEQDYRVVRPDGAIRWLYDFTVVARDEDDRVTHYEGYVLDITERKRAEEERRQLELQIQHAQKLESLGVLAGGIAHDFNNLLVGVLGYAGLAEMELPADSPARESVQKIEKAARRAADLTRQLLAYSGRGRFAVEWVDLPALVEEMAHLLQTSVSKKARLEYDFARDLPPIEGDATQLRQVVMNLITNASDALGDQSGAITLRSGVVHVDRDELAETYLSADLPEGPYVYVEVSDTGCGMDEETLAKIFDPFFTTKFPGRGLGLAAVLGIVRGHRGALKVTSEPGRGSTFRVLLPCGGRPEAPVEAEPAPGGNWRGAGTILVVDDEESVRAVAQLILERSGFAVLTAVDGREALDVFRAHRDEIALVLLDLTMPHLSGEETLQELRRISADVRVILSSGYNEQEVAGRDAGKSPVRFIQKPYSPSALIEKVREALAV